jgi:enoyl-CoA hydratase/carnithine racemase
MAQAGEVLFRLPIAATNGEIVVTQPQTQVYLLTFNSPADNRLLPVSQIQSEKKAILDRTHADNLHLQDFCNAFRLALDIIEAKYEPGVLITTSGIAKYVCFVNFTEEGRFTDSFWNNRFYSNGLDLETAVSTPNFFNGTLYALWRRILTYPMPTIALLNGHAFAGGAMTAMMHDYRFMNPSKGFFCLNEVELGANLQLPMSSIFRQKCTPQAYRLLVLEAARLNGPAALKEGIVDVLGDLNSAFKYIEERKLVAKAQPGMSGRAVFRALKEGMFAETVGYLENDGKGQSSLLDVPEKETREIESIQARVKQWEKQSKL